MKQIVERITGQTGAASHICASASAGRPLESDADEAMSREQVIANSRITNATDLSWTNPSFLVA